MLESVISRDSGGLEREGLSRSGNDSVKTSGRLSHPLTKKNSTHSQSYPECRAQLKNLLLFYLVSFLWSFFGGLYQGIFFKNLSSKIADLFWVLGENYQHLNNHACTALARGYKINCQYFTGKLQNIFSFLIKTMILRLYFEIWIIITPVMCV